MIPEPVKIGCVTLYNCDCMEFLRGVKDGQYELAICDPPYGMGGRWLSTGKSGFTLKPQEVEEMNKWDVKPDPEYFVELKRVSRNQIVWGANNFIEQLGSCRGPIIWDKGQHGFVLADGEFAYSSFDKPLRICPCGQSIRAADKKNVQGRWHSTQKPMYLYRWLLEHYAKPGQRILDTHLGSGTHAMACLEMGFTLDACEISKKYFDEAVKRIREYLGSHEKIFTDSSAVKLAS